MSIQNLESVSTVGHKTLEIALPEVGNTEGVTVGNDAKQGSLQNATQLALSLLKFFDHFLVEYTMLLICK